MELLSRLLSAMRGALPFALSCALILAGCGSPLPESPVQARSGSSDVVGALAADPELLEVIELGVRVAADVHARARSLSDEELDAVLRTLGHPQFQESADAQTVLTNLGSDPALLAQVRSHLQSLVARHGLQDLPPQQINATFSAAMSQSNIVEAIEAFIEEQLALEKDPEVEACEDQCELEYDVMVGVAMTIYIAAVAGSVGTGAAAVILITAATFAFGQAVLEAEAYRDRCIEECNGIFDDDCSWDPDCGADEYCWTGVLGIGKNECRPEKNEGQVCARDGQCESGCCKYHLPSHPLSQVCRPSNKCN